jgi:hypothetical protein
MSQGYMNLAWIGLSSTGSWAKKQVLRIAMTTTQRATEMAENLALKGLRLSEIQEALSELGLGASLSESELEAIMVKIDAAKSALPLEPSKRSARLVGIAAILVGAALLYTGRGSFLIVILGMGLLIWPRLGKTDVKNPFRVRW